MFQIGKTQQTHQTLKNKSVLGSLKFNTAAALLICLTSLSAQAVTYWVDDNGASKVAGSKKKIGEAMSLAKAGDVVNVLPGTYYESVTVKSGVTLQAMKTSTTKVNASNLSSNSDWPVIIAPGSGANGISSWAPQNTNIRGFLIRGAKNGIQVGGNVSGSNITSHCYNVKIEGNSIVDVSLDGIKVHQCDNVHIVGNRIDGFSLNSPQRDHGVDFVAVGNSSIRGNFIRDGGIGLVVKGGSINITIDNNTVNGPLKWYALSIGENGTNSFGWRSSYTKTIKYYAKHIMVKNNKINTGRVEEVNLGGCVNCSIVNNTLTSGRITYSNVNTVYVTKAACASGNSKYAPYVNIAKTEVKTSGCPSSYPAAAKSKNATYGWDMY